jgi:putative salt-induced outer membrane protein
MRRRLPLLMAGIFLSLFNQAQAQVPAPPVLYSPRPTAGDPSLDLLDAVWQTSLGLGLTSNTGNNRSSAFNLTLEASRLTDNSKLELNGRGLYTKFNNQVTGSNLIVGSQYDRDIDPLWFMFGKAEFMIDRPANIASRWSTYLGFGQHMIRAEKHSWDVAAGLGYTQDSYIKPAKIANEARAHYGRVEGILSQTSQHKLTETTSLRQKLGIFPNLQRSGYFRLVFDAGVLVAISSRLSVNVGLTYRHDSHPGTGFKKSDSLLVTGLSLKM